MSSFFLGFWLALAFMITSGLREYEDDKYLYFNIFGFKYIPLLFQKQHTKLTNKK